MIVDHNFADQYIARAGIVEADCARVEAVRECTTLGRAINRIAQEDSVRRSLPGNGERCRIQAALILVFSVADGDRQTGYCFNWCSSASGCGIVGNDRSSDKREANYRDEKQAHPNGKTTHYFSLSITEIIQR